MTTGKDTGSPELRSLNDTIWFKLSARGREVLADKFDALFETMPKDPQTVQDIGSIRERYLTPDSTISMELWQMAAWIGPFIDNLPTLIEDNIISFRPPGGAIPQEPGYRSV